MISALQKIDPIIKHPMHQPMFSSNSPRPDVGAKIFDRFRLTRALERVAENQLDQIEKPEGEFTIVLDEVS